MSINKKKIIVLGGGYGGIKAIETLANESDNIDVTLIDKNLYHYLQTESYNFVALNISLNDITISLNELIKGINKNFNFIQDDAVNIQDNTLICKNGKYEFDYLIIGVGSITKVPPIFKDKNFYEVKNLSNAIHLKQSFENTLWQHLNAISKNSNIVVIGGGSSGVEIAAEIKNYINQSKVYENINVTLIADMFLSELDESSKEEVFKILKDLGIDIIHKSVNKIENNKIYLEDHIIKYDFGVVATGIDTNEFINNLEFKKENKFLVVDEYLRVSDNIFAIGDCTILKDKNNNPLPQTAQTAEQSGVLAAKNIIRLIKQKPLIKADIKIYGLAIALGGKFAIAITSFIKIDGILAYLGKKAIEQFYKIPLKLKTNSS
ncbi:NAD(P)/FAD-dependent oxidoreductase [Hydrogenimonas thermophila]|uniref:NADH dehydrogenase n=1 Tax=Hydrogenimonas thermophila TaxID=223786 RepID=A0A1I5TN96_9BACT|nr:FAD-dependent oxidoreductase [Hydrogenimonas thermophila]WOE71050.1 FAD-dependent oxidoreductase [Hydrogenimonas thermophila]WOE73568.1 FAD-dependent oxidoreductase [Hydrogenimonas thermophila]SFP84520.1 NADH dehydrogenase [Hydrogenimonas thermophila]